MQFHRRRGFTLTELVVVIVLGAIVFGGLVILLRTVATTTTNRGLLYAAWATYEGASAGTPIETFEQAPAINGTIDAMRLNARLQQLIQQSDRSYIGGFAAAVWQPSGALPPDMSTVYVRYRPSFNSTFSDISATPLAHQVTPAQFIPLVATNLTPSGAVTTATPTITFGLTTALLSPNYSLFLVQGRNLIGILTVQRGRFGFFGHISALDNRAPFMYETILWTPTETFSYKFTVPGGASEGSGITAQTLTGTTQVRNFTEWLRYDPGTSTAWWNRRDIGYYVISLPDPWLTPGRRSGDTSAQQTRFRYRVPAAR